MRSGVRRGGCRVYVCCTWARVTGCRCRHVVTSVGRPFVFNINMCIVSVLALAAVATDASSVRASRASGFRAALCSAFGEGGRRARSCPRGSHSLHRWPEGGAIGGARCRSARAVFRACVPRGPPPRRVEVPVAQRSWLAARPPHRYVDGLGEVCGGAARLQRSAAP